ncbi:MAG: HAD family hydrolase [bacterium]
MNHSTMPLPLRAGPLGPWGVDAARVPASRSRWARPVVVFDYDGTLADSYEIKRQSYWRAVAEVLRLGTGDRPVVDASYARTSGAHRFEQFADTAGALRRAVTATEREEFSRRYSAYNKAAEEGMREFPAVRPVLSALRPRYDLVLASGLLHADLVADVARRGLASFFFTVEGGDKGRTLDRLRAGGRMIRLFVGDTPHDATVASARGVRFFMVRGASDLTRVVEVLR